MQVWMLSRDRESDVQMQVVNNAQYGANHPLSLRFAFHRANSDVQFTKRLFYVLQRSAYPFCHVAFHIKPQCFGGHR